MFIKKLKLFTNKLPELEQFYRDILEFEITNSSSKSFEIQIGNSRLIFEKSDQACYYHFAFNIPSFQSSEALDWLQKRVEILPDETGSPIADFVNWNAEAVYFYDPAGNILEYIARKNLNIQTNEKFTSDSVFEICEMGMPVRDVKARFDFLKSEISSHDFKKYSGDFERFCAAGDEHGLFIIIGPNKKTWYPTEKPALAFPFEMNFEVDAVEYHLKGNETFVLDEI